LIEARKLSFQEIWDSSTVFFVDEELEAEIEAQVEALILASQDPRISQVVEKTPEGIAKFLVEKNNALDIILKDLSLSKEKFKRIVSLLRKLGRIPGGFDTEWSLTKIKSKMRQDATFVKLIAELLVDGKRDPELMKYIPRYYLDVLNYREFKGLSLDAKRARYKESLIGTYGAQKGHRVERKIQEKLQEITANYGVSYAKGRSRFTKVDIDFAVPNLEDPWVIVMSTFQETTSSGQTNKTRDMLRSAFREIDEANSRYQERLMGVNR
jgi:hypothetical protein